MNKTYNAKKDEVTRHCYLLDANDKILGRVATKAAALLRGKHKAHFTPHVDTGDTVIIINASKVRVTGKKMVQKEYQRYTGYPGGHRVTSLEVMLAKRPTEVLILAVNRMLPRGALGSRIRRKLKVYAGDQHPHQAQKPVVLAV